MMWPLSRRAFFALSLASLASALVFYSSQGQSLLFRDRGIIHANGARVLDLKPDVVSQDLGLHDKLTEANAPQSRKGGSSIRTRTETSTTLEAISTYRAESSTASPTSPTTTPPNPHCKKGPVKNFMFLKTHKTGSSTVQNVLVRHAYRENLFVGLPKEGILFNYASGKPFVPTFMQPTPPGRKVNAILHHMIFNYEKVASVLPEDTIFITILRDPATQFESVFHYFRDNVKAFKRVNKSKGVAEFIKQPLRYFRGATDGHFWWFGKNNMMYDLGFNSMNETEVYFQETIEKMNKIFNFVMISEYFDVSLLLLKDLLCWDIEDMIYLSMNARNPSTVEHVTDDVRDNIYEWNKGDTALYKYYNDTFWKRVEEYGEIRMKNDLKRLENLKEEMADFCVESDMLSNKDVKAKFLKLWTPVGMDITQYKLKQQAAYNKTCLGLILPENSWYNKFNLRQYPRPPKPKWVPKPNRKANGVKNPPPVAGIHKHVPKSNTGAQKSVQFKPQIPRRASENIPPRPTHKLDNTGKNKS